MISRVNVERRKKPRMYQAIMVSVRSSASSGKSYGFETVARDIGAGGLCAFSPRIMEKGEEISLRIRFARPGSKPLQAPEILTDARVMRVEERPGGSCIFAVSFTSVALRDQPMR
jgi:hypothetical protein